MFDLDNWHELFSALRRNKLRSFLTAFGVFWGIFMLVVMLGAGRGLEKGATRGFSGFATNCFYLWAQNTSKPYKGFKSGRDFDFENDDIEALRKNVPECDIISARNQLGNFGDIGGYAITHGSRSGNFQVLGDFPQFLKIQPVKKLEGRFINPLDIKQKRKVAVIGKKVVQTLFGKDSVVIGQNIRIAGVSYQVVGVIRSGKGKEDETLESIYLPFTTFQQVFNLGKRIGWFSITSRTGIPCSVTEQKVIKLLAQRHSIAPDDKSAIGHWNMEEQFNKMSNLFTGIRVLIWIVGSGTLLAGIIGVSNIMLIVVRERTREIGIKRAIGASPRVILLQILSESVFLTVLAGYLGLIFGIFLIEGISAQLGEEGADMFVNPSVDLGVAATALGILVMGGLLAGLIPGMRALRVQTVEALRAE